MRLGTDLHSLRTVHRTRQEGDGFPVTSSLRIVLISCRLVSNISSDSK